MKIKRSSIRHAKNHVRAFRYNMSNHPGEVAKSGLGYVARSPIAATSQLISPTANAALIATGHSGLAAANAANPIGPGKIGAVVETALQAKCPKYREATKKMGDKVMSGKRINKILGTEVGKNPEFNTRARLRDLVQKGYSETWEGKTLRAMDMKHKNFLFSELVRYIYELEETLSIRDFQEGLDINILDHPEDPQYSIIRFTPKPHSSILRTYGPDKCWEVLLNKETSEIEDIRG